MHPHTPTPKRFRASRVITRVFRMLNRFTCPSATTLFGCIRDHRDGLRYLIPWVGRSTVNRLGGVMEYGWPIATGYWSVKVLLSLDARS